MAMQKMTILFSVLAIWVVGNVDSATPHNAPAPAVDCSSVILNMADCLSFVTGGSTVKKPEGNCCSGLKTVLKSNAECICEAFKNSAQLGITLNITKAATLPKACHVSAPSVSNCGLSLVNGAAPAISPAGAPLSPSTIAGVPTSVAGTNELSPAPAPGISGSGSATLTISVGSLIVAIVAASFSLTLSN